MRLYRAVTELQSGLSDISTFRQAQIQWNVVSLKRSTATETVSYLASVGDCVPCDPTDASVLVYLPDTRRNPGGAIIVANDTSATGNAIKVFAAGADTILGTTSFDFDSAYGALMLVSNGNGKWVPV